MIKYWTKEELILLNEKAKLLNIDELVILFNRSKSAIKCKLRKMEIQCKLKINRFTKEEEDYIKNNYKLITVFDMSKVLKRHYGAIRIKLKQMGLKGISSLHKLTPYEIEYIKQNYLEMSNDEIGKTLGLKRRAVEGGLHKMGIRRQLNFDIKSKTIIFCSVCKNQFEKTKENFYFSRTKENYLNSSVCKICSKEKVKKCNSGLENYVKMLLRGIRSDLKRKNKGGVVSDIDFNYIIQLYNEQNGKCKITNIKLTFSQKGGRCMTNLSIDRINSEIGYIKGNIQLLCHWANLAKTSLSMDEFKQFIQLANNNLNKKEICHELK